MKPANADENVDRGRLLAALCAVLAVGALLRFHALGALSFYYDELYATRIHGLTLRNLAGVVARTAFYDVHPPLYYVLALLWTSVTGVSEVAVRGLSAVCGLATLPVAYALGRDLHSRRVGLWSAAVLAVLPLHAYYSREARMYAMLVLFASLSTWLLVRLCRGDRARWLLPAWLAVTTAAALTHYFGVVHVMAEFAILVLRGRRGAAALPAWLTLFGVPAAVFVPFALFAGYQAKYAYSAYLGFGLDVYLDVLAWFGGGHSRLPYALAWAVPGLALAGLGARASWREQGEGWGEGAMAPPGPSPFERALWTLGGLGLIAGAAGVFVLRNKLAHMVTGVEVGRGESEALAIVQGQTATAGAFLGALAAGFVALGLAARDRITARVERWLPPRAEGIDRAGSLSWVALACVGVPVALTVVAGFAGRPLGLVRNFVIAAPFMALLIGRGIASLPRAGQVAAALVVCGLALGVGERFGAVPPGPPDANAVRPWLLHTYYDWRQLGGVLPDDDTLVVTVQHYATDAVLYYRGKHRVVRVAAHEGEGLVVGQVRTDDGDTSGFREGDAFSPELSPRFYLVDMGPSLVHAAGVPARLSASVLARHECRVVGVIPGGVTVRECTMGEAMAAR